MYTQEQLYKFIYDYTQFAKEVDTLLNRIEIVKTGKGYYGEIENIDIDINAQMVEVDTYEDAPCGCCAGENYYYTIPFSYFYTDWETDLNEEIQKKKEQERLKKAEQQRLESERQEEIERKYYEELKKKFEGKWNE